MNNKDFNEFLHKKLEIFRQGKMKEFYQNTLPEKLESLRSDYNGDPDDLESYIEDTEEELILDFAEELDKMTADEQKRLEKLHRKEFEADREPLATEIIAGLKEENQRLKEELTEVETDRNLFHNQYLALILQMDIFNTVMKIDDVSLLRMALGMMNGVYNQQIEKEQESENNEEM